MVQIQSPLFRYERHPDEELGRRLIASADIPEGRLIFVERPVVAMQAMGNMHEGVLICSYCMAFCGGPENALRVASDPLCLEDIARGPISCIPVGEGRNNKFSFNVPDESHAMHTCRFGCGHIYCSLECQQDDWEWGGHKELCTGTIVNTGQPVLTQQPSNTFINSDDESDNDQGISATQDYDDAMPPIDPLLEFKMHAANTNEIFFLVAVWLVRILKHNIPYHDDDNANTHPYTDFQMSAWWDVKAKEEELIETKEDTDKKRNDDDDQVQKGSLTEILKQLCEESHLYLSQTLKSRMSLNEPSPWLTAIGMARLIGSLEQNCLGIRRKHALRRNIMQDTKLRQDFHAELIQCLEGAGMIGDSDASDDADHDTDHHTFDDADADHDAIVSSTNDADDIDEVESRSSLAESTDINNFDTAAGVDVDEETNENEETDYLPDEIAAFLAGLTQDLTSGCEVDEWDELFTPLDGVSHYSTVTKMNHSCDPNVIVVYKTRGWGRDHPLVAYVVALKDIAEGEELTISYITSEESYEERQTALANYGFVCECSKCERERNNIVKGETEINSAEDDDLFGEDDEDENDLFGDSDDDDEGDEEIDNETKNEDGDQEELSGEQRLLNAAEELDSIRNKSSHIAIPLTMFAPVSNYVIKQVSTLLQDIQSEKELEGDKETIQNLLTQNMDAVKDRDYASCRIVGSDLELCLYNQLESNGSWTTPMHRASHWCASITASIGYAHEGSFLVSLKYLDKATILGQDRSIFKDYFGYVELHASQMAAAPCPIAVECKVSDFQSPELRELVGTRALSRPIQFPANEFAINVDSDKTDILVSWNQSRSCVIRGLASKWSAVKKWREIDVLAREFGHRLVPIEVGAMMSEMEEAVVPFRHFVARYMSTSARKDCWSLDDATIDENTHIAYLAQHPLLDQIPALANDIDMNPCGVRPTNVNIWMGTGGTRTPLHFDSYDNLLVQLVGAKYVRLYEKECSPKLYVSNDKSYGGQGNMSELDCEREDFEQHPLARDCNYTEVLLFPGDCLFIPSRQWHYVRSLSTSVSINYWF